MSHGRSSVFAAVCRSGFGPKSKIFGCTVAEQQALQGIVGQPVAADANRGSGGQTRVGAGKALERSRGTGAFCAFRARGRRLGHSELPGSQDSNQSPVGRSQAAGKRNLPSRDQAVQTSVSPSKRKLGDYSRTGKPRQFGSIRASLGNFLNGGNGWWA